MYDFKKFLFQTEGEVAFYFWLDVERLKLSSQSSIWNRKLILEIFETYITVKSSFRLTTPLRENLIKLYISSVGKVRIPWNTRRITNELILCQKEVLERLSNYWCHRFVHSLAMSAKPSRIESSNTDKFGFPVPGGQVVPLPSIILSRGNGKVSKRFPSIYCHETSPSHVPEEIQKTRYLVHDVSRASFAKRTQVPNVPTGLLASTTNNLLHESTVTPFLSLLNKPDHEEPFNFEPFLNASMRADFVAGNHFLRYLKKTQPSLQASNYLLFWQSIEMLGIKDEMKCWYNIWSYQTRQDSDVSPVCPYINYYEPHLIAKDLRELCSLFLSREGLHRIFLPKEMNVKLEMLVQKGLGQSFALDAQKFAAQVRQEQEQ